YQFVYRGDRSRLAAHVQITFVRTGGSAFFGKKAPENGTIALTTDDQAIAFFFPPGIYSAGLDPVLGDLIVDLPAPIGRTIRHDYPILPTARFNDRVFAIQETGP